MDHYFSQSPHADDSHQTVTTQIWGRSMTFTTSPGVFSVRGLDKATEILLNNSSTPCGGGIHLDLGCGWGPIACAIAASDPAATVWAVDTNTRALDLTRCNATALDGTVHACLPEDVPADLTFDYIWSNPPIRVGKEVLHGILLHWLERLSATGTARLVVGKHLGADSLQRWLSAQGWQAHRLVSQKSFRILEIRR